MDMLGICLSYDGPDFLFTHKFIVYFFKCYLIYHDWLF